MKIKITILKKKKFVNKNNKSHFYKSGITVNKTLLSLNFIVININYDNCWGSKYCDSKKWITLKKWQGNSLNNKLNIKK